jgi:serine/threonine-protein kinase HipA
MKNRCLYCYAVMDGGADFHEKCSMAFFGSKTAPHILYSLDQMSELAKSVVERSISVPGVQPKLSMSIVEDAVVGNYRRLTIIDALGGHFILKPPSADYPELPQNEHVCMRIAEALGINVVQSSLIKLQSGELAYITKRIDRLDNGTKVHMLDMFQIIEAVDKYKGSMEKVGKALGIYSSNPQLDKLFLFEITLFSFLIGNNDMHLKNFSMILSSVGWVLAPAYDLLNVAIALPEDEEELALTLEGKKRKFKRSHFERFGQGMGLTDRQISGVFRRFQSKKASILEWVDRSFFSDESKKNFVGIVETRFSRIDALEV